MLTHLHSFLEPERTVTMCEQMKTKQMKTDKGYSELATARQLPTITYNCRDLKAGRRMRKFCGGHFMANRQDFGFAPKWRLLAWGNCRQTSQKEGVLCDWTGMPIWFSLVVLCWKQGQVFRKLPSLNQVNYQLILVVWGQLLHRLLFACLDWLLEVVVWLPVSLT